MTLVLSTEQCDFYKTYGYLHAPAVIPSDLLDLMTTVLSRWADDTIRNWLSKGLIDNHRTDLDLQHRLAHLWEAAGRPQYIRSPHRALPNRSNQVRWSIDVRFEPTAQATESGQKQGFIAHSLNEPGTVPTYEEWLKKWEEIPSGSY